MSEGFITMVNECMQRGWLPNSIARGPIVLLVKDEYRLKLINWRPITLLNSIYKDFAKVLQQRLQPLLVKVVDNDQIAFSSYNIHFGQYCSYS